MSADGGPPRSGELDRQVRLELIRRIQQYFEDEFELPLGDLRAGFVLDFFGELIGPVYYNLAVEHARAVASARAQTTDEELFGLTRRLPPAGKPRPEESGEDDDAGAGQRA